MKHLLPFFLAFPLLFLSPKAKAEGRLTLTNSFLGEELTHAPTLKFSVDEKVLGKVFVNGFLALGSFPDGSNTKHWGAFRFGFDYRDEKFSAGLGYTSNAQVDDWFSLTAIRSLATEPGYYAKMSWLLW